MDGSVFKHDSILGFVWDSYGITLELSRDPNVAILAPKEMSAFLDI